MSERDHFDMPSVSPDQVRGDVFVPEECTWPDCGCDGAERLHCAVDPPPVGHPLTNAIRDARLIRDLTQVAHQYRFDMIYPPPEASRRRRVAWIDDVLGRVEAR